MCDFTRKRFTLSTDFTAQNGSKLQSPHVTQHPVSVATQRRRVAIETRFLRHCVVEASTVSLLLFYFYFFVFFASTSQQNTHLRRWSL